MWIRCKCRSRLQRRVQRFLPVSSPSGSSSTQEQIVPRSIAGLRPITARSARSQQLWPCRQGVVSLAALPGAGRGDSHGGHGANGAHKVVPAYHIYKYPKRKDSHRRAASGRMHACCCCQLRRCPQRSDSSERCVLPNAERPGAADGRLLHRSPAAAALAHSSNFVAGRRCCQGDSGCCPSSARGLAGGLPAAVQYMRLQRQPTLPSR